MSEQTQDIATALRSLLSIVEMHGKAVQGIGHAVADLTDIVARHTKDRKVLLVMDQLSDAFRLAEDAKGATPKNQP